MLIEIAPPSFIAEGSRTEGTLTFFSGTQVFGLVEGNLIHQSLEPLQIGKTGWIHGAIQAQGPVLIEGRVEGDIRSATQIRLLPTATVRGTLSAPTIEIRAGAQVEGDLHMETASAPDALPAAA